MSYPVGLWFDLHQTFWFYKKTVDVIDHRGEKRSYRLILSDNSETPLVDQLFTTKVVRKALKQGCYPTLSDRGIVLTPESKHANLLELCSKVDGLEEDDMVLLRGFEMMLRKGQYGLAGDSIKILYETSPQTTLLELYAEFLKLMKDPQASSMFMQLYQRSKVRSDFLIDALLADPNNKEACEELEKFARTPSGWMHLYLYIYVRTHSKLFLKKASRIDTKSPLLFLAQVSCAKTTKEKREAYAKLADLYTELGEEGLARYYRSKNPEIFFKHAATSARVRIIPKTIEPAIRKPSMLERIPALSKIIEMREGISHEEAEKEPIYESKGIKRDLLDYIDCAVKNSEWENPVQIIQELIHSVVAERGLPVGSFYKRCLALCQETGRRDVLLKKMWEIYTENNKLHKATVIYRLYQSDYEEIDRHLEMTAFLMQKGVWIREMGITLFALIQHCIQSNHYEKALKSLLLLDQHDAKFFSHHEQIELFVMRKIIEWNLGEKALQDVPLPRLKLKNPSQSDRKVRKRGIIVHLDHPTFFVCYVIPTHRYFFTKKQVEVVHSKDKSVNTYPLKLVRPSEMPIQAKLSTNEAIRWLLENGFSPVVHDDAITFVQLTDRDLFQPIIRQCAELRSARKQRDTLQALLWIAEASFKEEIYGVAISYLQKAYAISQNTADEPQVRQLHEDAEALKLQTVICLEEESAISDPRTEWLKRFTQLCTELGGIDHDLASSLQSCKLYVELASDALAKVFLETAFQSCAEGPYKQRIRELIEELIKLEESSPAPLPMALEAHPTLSEEVFHALVQLSQLPTSKTKPRAKLLEKLIECDPINREYYEQRMLPVDKKQTHEQIGSVEQAQQLVQQYKSKGNHEKARAVALYLFEHFKHFETGMQLADAMIFNDQLNEGLNIYFEIALESLQTYQIGILKQCVAALLLNEENLDETQKKLLSLLTILAK